MFGPARCIISTAAICPSRLSTCSRLRRIATGVPGGPHRRRSLWDGGIYSNTPIETVFDDFQRREIRRVHGSDVAGRRAGAGIGLAGPQSAKGHSIREPRRRPYRPSGAHPPASSYRTRTRQPDAGGSTRHAESQGDGQAMAATRPCTSSGSTRPGSIMKIICATSISRAPEIHARWQAGYADTMRTLNRRPWEVNFDPVFGVAVHNSDAPATPDT